MNELARHARLEVQSAERWPNLHGGRPAFAAPRAPLETRQVRSEQGDERPSTGSGGAPSHTGLGVAYIGEGRLTAPCLQQKVAKSFLSPPSSRSLRPLASCLPVLPAFCAGPVLLSWPCLHGKRRSSTARPACKGRQGLGLVPASVVLTTSTGGKVFRSSRA